MERFGPTRRGGPVFRWLGEPLAIDLANTVMVVREGESIDLLDSAGALASWLELERPRLGHCGFALGHLDQVRDAREDVRTMLGARSTGTPIDGATLDRVNAASREAPVAVQLEVGGDGRPKVANAAEVEDMPSLLGAFARSTIELVANHEEDPLGVCGAPSCGMFFLGRRRWCCGACGNRARAARHYRSRRAARR